MNNKIVRFIAEVGIFAAIGLVLDFVAGIYSEPIWPNGGSISIAMVVIFIMAFRWGLKGGLLTGLIIGIVQIIYAMSGKVDFIQVLLDYVIAYTIVGISGLYSKKIAKSEQLSSKMYYIINAVIIAGLLRTVIHIITGIVYFAMYTPEGFIVYYYSTIYNLGYMVPSIILCIVVLRILVQKYPTFIEPMF